MDIEQEGIESDVGVDSPEAVEETSGEYAVEPEGEVAHEPDDYDLAEKEVPKLAEMSLQELKELQEIRDQEEKNTEGLQGKPETEYKEDNEIPENAEEPQQQVPSPRTNEPNPQLQQLANTVRVRREGVTNLRQQHIEALNHLEAQAREIAEDNPREAAKLDREVEKIHAAIGTLDSDLQELNQYEQNLQIVPRFIPEGNLFPDEIAESLVEDGYSVEAAQDYVQNMFRRESPVTIIAHAKNGMLRKALKNLLLEKQNSAQAPRRIPPSTRKASTPDSVAEVINKAKAMPKTLSPAPMSASREPTISDEDLANMSLAELKQLQKQIERGHV